MVWFYPRAFGRASAHRRDTASYICSYRLFRQRHDVFHDILSYHSRSYRGEKEPKELMGGSIFSETDSFSSKTTGRQSKRLRRGIFSRGGKKHAFAINNFLTRFYFFRHGGEISFSLRA